MSIETYLEIHGTTILIGSAVLSFVIFRLIEGINSNSWPSTLGTVVSSDIKSDFVDNTPGSYTEIRYGYEVENHEYFSTINMSGPFETYSSAKYYLEKYPIGKVMTVYYKLQEPETCRLTTGATFWNYAQLAAVLLLALWISRNLIVVLLIIGIAFVCLTIYRILDRIVPTNTG